MTKSIEAHINPKILTWARESARMTVDGVSIRIGVDSETIEKWESGEAKPSISKLRRLSNIYKRSFATFFISETPSLPSRINDFRQIRDDETEVDSSNIEFEIRKAKLRREIAIQLANALNWDDSFSLVTQNLAPASEEMSAQIREALMISINDQKNWKDRYVALKKWIAALESKGILIFQVSRIPSTIMRGFSISEDRFPIIGLNGSDSPRGRIFSLMHELAHLILHNGGLCDTVEYRNDNSPNQRIERFCNRFSANLLIPKPAFESEYLLRTRTKESEWSDDDIKYLSDSYKVSREVIIGRLFELDRISRKYYDRKLRQYIEQFTPASSGGGDYYKTILRNNGFAYTHLIFNAHDRGLINLSEVSDYLNIKVQYLSRLQEEFKKIL